MSNIYRSAAGSPLREAETWIFDLDNTLYPASYDLFGQIDARMRAYIAAFLGLPLDDAYRLQKRYFHEYGTSLSGLMQRHDMDPQPFLAHVHDIDVTVLPPDAALDAALARLPGRKVIFTNASAEHAQRVVDRLGIGDRFDGVFDIVEAGYRPKPEPGAYALMIERFGLDPATSVMVEDMARNLAPAASLGMTTVWVRTDAEHGSVGLDAVRIDHVVDHLASWLEDVAANGTVEASPRQG
jgi:putative hydrolase of the HAD superfamily